MDFAKKKRTNTKISVIFAQKFIKKQRLILDKCKEKWFYIHKTKDMENKKLKIGWKTGLPIVEQMITDTSICKQLGVNKAWLDMRKNERKVRNYTYTFSEEDIKRLNEAIHAIGGRLSETVIVFSDDKQAVIDQIRGKLQDVYTPYVYKERLGKPAYWYKARMQSRDNDGYMSSFKEEDILKINLIVAEISGKLLSIELAVGE